MVAHDVGVVAVGVRGYDQVEQLAIGGTHAELTPDVDRPLVAETRADVRQVDRGDQA